VNALTLQLLDWLDSRPRTYAETMSAWRTSCPRLTVWEDALQDGLVQVRTNGTGDRREVVLTARGRALIDGTRT
jgi:hypothetical protein